MKILKFGMCTLVLLGLSGGTLWAKDQPFELMTVYTDAFNDPSGLDVGTGVDLGRPLGLLLDVLGSLLEGTGSHLEVL